MHILTSHEMRMLDEASIKRYGIPSLTLMENAGAQFFKQLRCASLKGKTIWILCGPGNNGGDGLVIARLLWKAGARARVFLITGEEELSADAKAQFRKVQSKTSRLQFVRSPSDLPSVNPKKPSRVFIIDALFGTGLSRPVKGLYASVISWINSQPVERWSVDTPSGLCADTGRILGCAVKAATTVTFGFPKRGFFLREGPEYVGDLHVADIGLSQKAIAELNPRTHLTTIPDVASLLRPRRKNTHKGTYGHAFVIAGSLGKIGAGVMAAHTALRVGCGLSTLILPSSAYTRVDMQALELMYEPIHDAGRGFLSYKDFQTIMGLTAKASVVAVGPGLGTHPDTVQLVRNLVHSYQGPMVIDADGLNALNPGEFTWKPRHGLTVLTPHPGEMARLLNRSVSYVNDNRLEVALDYAAKNQVVVLLKGYRSIIAFPDGQAWVNPTGNPGMASAGQGDVLTGIFAGLIAQYGDKREAVLLAPFLHGLVGDQLYAQGIPSVLAMDVAENLKLGFGYLRREKQWLVRSFY